MESSPGRVGEARTRADDLAMATPAHGAANGVTEGRQITPAG
ncbi:MAG: hypothetical protein SNJ69_09960 [Chloroflexaceae bacterium]